jgi:hypothetical protein
MTSHIIPEDGYNHIEDIGCSCNPIVTVVEGEEIIYHNNRKYGDLTVNFSQENFDYFWKNLDKLFK